MEGAMDLDAYSMQYNIDKNGSRKKKKIGRTDL
jgi:hypothetical protein